MEVIEAFLARTQHSMRLVTLNELIVIGSDRRTIRRTTQEVTVAVADEVVSRCIFYDPDDVQVDIDRLHLNQLRNCTVKREYKDPSGRAKMFELELVRPLNTGDTQILLYTADFLAARTGTASVPPTAGDEIAGFFWSPASYVLQVQFHERALPTQCTQIYQARPTGPIQRVRTLELTSADALHIALVNPKPGGHGITWRWDA